MCLTSRELFSQFLGTLMPKDPHTFIYLLFFLSKDPCSICFFNHMAKGGYLSLLLSAKDAQNKVVSVLFGLLPSRAIQNDSLHRFRLH